VIAEPCVPPVGPEVDLRGYGFMPLYGHHLFGSDFNARVSDAGWRAAVTLWWAAWNQVPAGSLPGDDVALCRLADLGRDVKAFRKLKDEALHGFELYHDGRLYHGFLCGLVLEAWERRLKERDRKAKWRESRARDKDVPETGTSTGTERGHVVGRNGRQGQGQGQGQGPQHQEGASHLLSGLTPDPVHEQRTPTTKAKGKTIGQNFAKDARELIEFLNEKAGKRFPATDSNVGIIVARMKEGFTAMQIRQVVAMKVRAWKGKEDMAEYLRPETLFGRKKFSNYVGELVEVVDADPPPNLPVDCAHEPQPEAAT
jgi:uncharacterized phage protein (TIGR02220 family)